MKNKETLEILPTHKRLTLRQHLITVGIAIIIPTIFMFLIVGLIQIGQSLHIFYMRMETPFVLALILFPIAIIYCHLRWKAPRKTSKRFLLISLITLLAVQTLSTTIESINTLPVANIEKNFIAPQGWVKETSGNGTILSPGKGLFPCIELMGDTCPYAKSTWSVESGTKMGLKDLEKIAKDNGYIGLSAPEYAINEGSPANYPSITGVIDGQKVSLSFSSSGREAANRELRLYINY